MIITAQREQPCEVTGARYGLKKDEYSTNSSRVSCPSTATVTDRMSLSSAAATNKPFSSQSRAI